MLKSISWLENANDNEINSYINELVSDGWEEEEIKEIVNNAKCYDQAIITIVYLAVRYFLFENSLHIEYWIKDKCPFENMRALCWRHDDKISRVALFKYQVESIETAILLADTGATTPEGMVSLQQLTTYTKYDSVKPLLFKLGIIEQLPEISETQSITDTTARFSSAVWYEKIKEKTIILAGLGGIGSWTNMLLARLQPKAMYIYDDDNVEAVNMAGQLYQILDVGKKKVDVSSDVSWLYADYRDVFAVPYKFGEEAEPGDVMISGFDNMDARKLFFKKWINHISNKTDEEKKHCLYIDGRLSAEELQVFCLRGDDILNQEIYRKQYLFSHEEADETVCSYKQTSFMANMIAGIIVNLFTNFAANEVVEGLRDLPFFTSYTGESMMFKTKY